MRWTVKPKLPFAIVLLAVSCAEPPRERNVEVIAETACDRFDECGDLDALGYGSYAECASDMEAKFFGLWPADRCDDGQMNRDAYLDCLDRAEVYPCNANLVDLLSFLSSCNADAVCIDPAK